MRRRLSARFVLLAGWVGSWCGACVETPAQPNGSFIDVKPVRGVNSPFREGPGSTSADGLTFYFISDRPWNGAYDELRWDLYQATRPAKSEPFGNVRELAELNTPFGDASPKISRDGLRLYFASNRPGGQSWDVWVVLRDDVNQRFTSENATNQDPLQQINSSTAESSPAIDCEEEMLIFVRYNGLDNGQFDLWMATRDTALEPFGALESLMVNTEFAEHGPHLSCDGSTLFFCDGSLLLPGLFRPRPGGLGGDDLWIAWREPIGGPFASRVMNAVDLGRGLSTPYHDLGPVVDFDWPEQASVLYFASDRPHPLSKGGEADIYQATWLALSSADAAVTFESEPPRTSGAVNCGGWEVDGAVFERDRFFGDDLSWSGDPDAGFVVTRTVLGHEPTDPRETREEATRGLVWSGDNPRSVDVATVAGAGAAMATLFATHSWSPRSLHYEARVVPGRYEVTLYFAEGSPEAMNGLGQGTRLLDVSVGGEAALCNWSAASAAGSATVSGDPQVACNAVLDTAVARRFSVDVADSDPADEVALGTLDIVLEASETGDLAPALDAFRFQRTGDVTGVPLSGDIECLELDPAVDPRAAALERARERWQGSGGELFVNCGGSLLACSATENPAPGALHDPDAGSGDPVDWVEDLATGENSDPAENEFFKVIPLDNGDGTNDGLRVLTTDMGFWDARGTDPGWDQNDRMFHQQRLGDVEYEIPVDAGDYELTLYFANALGDTAGTALRFFRIEIQGQVTEGDDTMAAFPHCRVSALETDNPVFSFPDLYDPVDHAEELYSPDPCNFEVCAENGVTWTADPDGDGIPGRFECGNGAATALIYTVTVTPDDGSLKIALREPDLSADPPQPPSPDMDPSIAGISVRRLHPGVSFVRGDCNADGATNLTDAVFLLNHLFRGGPAPTCAEACNTDDEGPVNLTDAVFLLNHLFRGGPAVPAPATCEVLGGADCQAFPPCQ